MRKSVKFLMLVIGLFAMVNVPSLYAQEKMTGEDLTAIQEDFEKMQEVLVIDVRPEEQYDEGHITYAVNIPVDKLAKEMARIEEAYGKDFPIVVYCNSENMSKEAKQLLDDAGYKDVTIAEGVKDFEYTLVTYDNILLDEFLEALESDSERVVIDYQFEKDFNQRAVSDAILGDPEKMDPLLEQLPEDKATPIYNYCYVGVRSGLGSQIIKDAGYENVYNLIVGTSSDEFPAEEK
ncbi:rhodanese-like domain-containing protein [Facklamia sp. DSM 111018]|uniref:Rhodanese-like domain-containing protein n=1 Tax=Facklamia lactis TaxID=2749967 RepID=A0ABS0LTS8_9LACT|nr:rhodanese-like domain-containing protein [Facklamia lactis]MBG9980933.1 rhodanese-like domain-containing protein [Facklamia lactis]MBG9986704.1 rhodanese-like domain-containing protein [Facklamia lactis]